MIIDREEKTALVTDIAVPLTHNLPKTVTQKITKYENLALQIKNIWKLNNVSIYPLGYVMCASDQCVQVFPAHSLEQTNTYPCKSGCPAWKHVKQMLW